MDEPFYYLSAEDVVPDDVVHLIIGGSVTVVAPSTFEDHESLGKVELQEGVEMIGARAFAYCPNLTRVDCRASSLHTIGNDAFAGCARLSEVILREGLRWIMPGAFSGCDLRRIAVPSSVVDICNSAFDGCERLSEVNLREGLRRIGLFAFNGCDSLERIIVPSSVMEIGAEAFAFCDNLEAATLAGGMVVVESDAFTDCPRLERVAISSMAIVIKAGEDGNCRVATATGGIELDPANESPRLIMASAHLASMRPKELRSLMDAIDQMADTTRGEDPLDLADGDVRRRIRACFVDRLSAWYRGYKREVATILELGLWKIELGRAVGGQEAAGAEVPTRDDCRRTCGADPIVGLVLSSLAGPHRRADQAANAGSIQP